VEEVRVSYVNQKTLDQLEEWMQEKPIPYISNDKFSQGDIFQYWIHGCPVSGTGIERVFFPLENSMMPTLQETEVTYSGRSLVGGRVWRRWLSDGLIQWL
jgi:hypothetical protein